MTRKHRNLPLLLLKTREGVMAHFRPILNEHGLTEQQWRVIRVLLDHGDLEPRELCRICCILSPSMAGILKRMEELELIEKLPLKDLRRIIIKLTPKAQQLALEVTQKNEQCYARIEDLIGSENLSQLYTSLDQVLKKLDV